MGPRHRESDRLEEPRTALSRKRLWDAAPAPLKAAVGGALSMVPLGLLLGRTFRQSRRFVAASQYWPARQTRAYQLAGLARLCEVARGGSAFYREHFEQAGLGSGPIRDFETFERLATIDRDTVRVHGDRLCVGDVRKADRVSTGGTSGKPVVFYQPPSRSGVEYAYLVSSWERAGFRLGGTMAVLRGRVVGPDRHGLHHEYDPLLRHHYYSSFHLSDDNLARYLAHIARIGPCFLHGYPSSVGAIVRFGRRSGAKCPANIRGIIVESEIVYPQQRQGAVEMFGCRYFACYGHTEKLVLACECERSGDYHVWPTYGHFELLDAEGTPVRTPGRRGEIVATGFINHLMPLIRYRTGDFATYVADRCDACGREHPIIRDIRGHRTQEVLIAADGSAISWTAMNMHDDTFDCVRQFQFLQDQPGRAILRIVPADGFDKACERRIRAALGRKFDGALTLGVQIVEAIPLSGRGKAIYVDQAIRQDQLGRHVLLDQEQP